MGRKKKTDAEPENKQLTPAEIEKARDEEALLAILPKSEMEPLGQLSKKVSNIQAELEKLNGMESIAEDYIPRKFAELIIRVSESITDDDLKRAGLRDKAFLLDALFKDFRMATGRGSSQIDIVHMLSSMVSELNPAAKIPMEIVKEITVVQEEKDAKNE